MYRKFTVPIPEVPGKITVYTVNGITYVRLEVDRVYIPEKKYTTVTRKVIGRLCEYDSTLMYPNENYYRYFPDEAAKEVDEDSIRRASYIKAGGWIVARWILERLDILDWFISNIGPAYGGLILDFALYLLMSEGNEAQHYPDYAWEHPLITKDMKIYSDATISDLLCRRMDGEVRVEFLNWWTSRCNFNEKIYISYDATNKSTQAGDLTLAEFGHSKDGESDRPIYNYSIAHDITNSTPLFYEEYPGSVIDVRQLEFMVEKAASYGFRKVGFILDRGYFSSFNMRWMDENGYSFILMMKGQKKLVSSLVEEMKGSFEEDSRNLILQFSTYGITVKRKLYSGDSKERYIHLYYSSSKNNAERQDFENMLAKTEKELEKNLGKVYEPTSSFITRYYTLDFSRDGKLLMFSLNNDEANERIRLSGYFCIVTSEKMDARKALVLYKGRDSSEKLFMADKTFLGGSSLRVHSQESTDNKLFVSFIALIVRNYMYRNINAYVMASGKRSNYFNVPSVLRELEKLVLIRQADGHYRLDRAITKKMKEVFSIFSMDEEFIRAEVKKLSDELFRLEQLASRKRTKDEDEADEEEEEEWEE